MSDRSALPAADQLRSVVERIERAEVARAEASDDVKSIYAEAKSNGFSVKALRAVVKDRKRDAAERAELELAETYLAALGASFADSGSSS